MPTDPDAVIDAAVQALKPSPRRLARVQVWVAACCLLAVGLLVSSVLSLYALLGQRHERQVDFNRSFNAGLCQVVDFLADPHVAPDAHEIRFREHYGCKPRSVQ